MKSALIRPLMFNRLYNTLLIGSYVYVERLSHVIIVHVTVPKHDYLDR